MKHNKLRDDRHSIYTYVFFLSLTMWCSQRATRVLLKKSRNFKKFKILEFKTKILNFLEFLDFFNYNVKKWSRQEKRNFLSWKSRQDKKCSLRQEILSWWNTTFCFSVKVWTRPKIQCDPDRRYTSRVNICCRRISPLTRGSWIAYRLSVSPGAAPSRRAKASELSQRQRREQRGKRQTADAAAPARRSWYQRPTVPFLAAELESARTENLYLQCIPTKLCEIKSLVVVANRR